MSRSILLALGIYVMLSTINRTMGFNAAYDLGYGAISLVAIVISVTFAWLWRVRATPMALGMALSWAGCHGLVGYWWVYNQIGRDPSGFFEHDLLFAFISLYFTGAILHLSVISRAYFKTRLVFWCTLCGVVGVSAALAYAVG